MVVQSCTTSKTIEFRAKSAMKTRLLSFMSAAHGLILEPHRGVSSVARQLPLPPMICNDMGLTVRSDRERGAPACSSQIVFIRFFEPFKHMRGGDRPFRLTFLASANFARANFLASRSLRNVSVALGCRCFAHGRSNETYHVPRDLLAMRPSRGLGPQRTILCFLVAFRSGLRALLLVTTESSHHPYPRQHRRAA